jgi:hypothetical protein
VDGFRLETWGSDVTLGAKAPYVDDTINYSGVWSIVDSQPSVPAQIPCEAL